MGSCRSVLESASPDARRALTASIVPHRFLTSINSPVPSSKSSVGSDPSPNRCIGCRNVVADSRVAAPAPHSPPRWTPTIASASLSSAIRPSPPETTTGSPPRGDQLPDGRDRIASNGPGAHRPDAVGQPALPAGARGPLRPGVRCRARLRLRIVRETRTTPISPPSVAQRPQARRPSHAGLP